MGILVERHGWAVNWSAYATKMCHYGGCPFEALRTRRHWLVAAGMTAAKEVGPNWSKKEGNVDN